MRYTGQNTVEDLKVAYVGGGSRGWAWGLMSDLASAGDLSGQVWLYDINEEAARRNAVIGNRYNALPDANSKWEYFAAGTLEEALTDADFVVISILPGSFDEMASDVHTPEKYGIYQSVGDTTGPGGILRALRTIPQMQVIAQGIRDYCPGAWVINYTNPMAQCVKALYDAFPEIKAFGCCHEVFGAQCLLATAVEEILGVPDIPREDIKINVLGVNHFTWITEAKWKGRDVLPIYRQFAEKYAAEGYGEKVAINWDNTAFMDRCQVKMNLFLRLGVVAAAGDRHLAEFCPKNWYLTSEAHANSWGFGLTPVAWRKERQQKREDRSLRLASGEEPVKIKITGEEGVQQMRALLGLSELITNVNLPNRGQVANLPLGTVVETNAVFRGGSLLPIFAGSVPLAVDALVRRIADAQLLLAQAGRQRDLEIAFRVFSNDPLVELPLDQARALFNEMVENTKTYLQEYFQ